jgi:hypothetical protein
MNHLNQILMVYLQKNMVKFDFDWEITINYDKLQEIMNSLFSVFHPFMNSFKFKTIQFISIWFCLLQ